MAKRVILFIVLISTISMLSFATVVTDSVTLFRKTNSHQLKILTWNIYMLPHCSLIHGNCNRARMIAKQLTSSDYDIIVFEEAFDGRARGILRRKLSKTFPNMYGPANNSFLSFRANSGLWVLSKISLKKVEQIQYYNRFGIDAMARKGAVMFEGNWNGQEFQLIGTHLQADSPDEIRRAQCQEIATRLLLKNAKENVPQIICGDFNIESTDTVNYQHMLHTLEADNGCINGPVQTSFDELNNTLAVRTNGKKQMIDYILTRNNRFLRNIQRKISVLRVSKHNKTFDLSDHYGVEAIVEFSSNELTAGNR